MLIRAIPTKSITFSNSIILRIYPRLKMAGQIPNRIVIYVKDIENITGRKRRTCQHMLSRIRKYYNKNKEQLITVDEFCNFMNIREQIVREFLH
jgi:hypothetical protein